MQPLGVGESAHEVGQRCPCIGRGTTVEGRDVPQGGPRFGGQMRAAFGDQVVDHYLNYARTEQALFDKTVTDWERRRYFERG